ncbi:MAG: protein-L-isoaspartate O-methyltransferase [Candidatus Micrarchaeota archaeon]
MVERLIASGFLKSADVKDAMLSVDRAMFFPPSAAMHAYEDIAYPVGFGQTISAPTVVSFMLEKLLLAPGMKVLEVGSGTGYNTALLSRMVGGKGRVIGFDLIPELVELARKNLERCKALDNIELHAGDASCGYAAQAPYDRIIVTAAMPKLDRRHPMVGQLKPDGRIVAPVGDEFRQELVVYDKKSGTWDNVLPVIFVPLRGECGFR